MKLIDITNQTFGDLTAKKTIRVGKRSHWKCQCKCGNFIVVPGWQLRSGNNTNCGCRHTQRLVGKKFSKLLVIKNIGRDGNKRTKWLCKCDCGSTVNTYTRYLERGSKVDCGCGDKARKMARGLRQRKPDIEVASSKIWWEYKGNAEVRGLKFAFTKPQFMGFILANCFYCNSKPSREVKIWHRSKPVLVNGLDRLDSSIGYEAPNVVTCCWQCNRMKSDIYWQDFLDHIRKIQNWQEA